VREGQSDGRDSAILPKEIARHRLAQDVETTYLIESTGSSTQASARSSTLLSPPRSLPFPFPLEVPAKMTPAMQTFNHFGTVTACSMGSDIGQAISRGPAMEIALEKPYLMHAINGVSAAHLCHLLPAAQHPVQHGQSRLAATYHWHKALQLFRDELSNGANKKNMDGLMSAVMLICVHQFMLNEPLPDPSTSFIYAPRESRRECLAWLRIQHGFMALRAQLGEVIWDSIWNPVFQDSEISQLAPDYMTAKAGDETHGLFLEICEATEGSSRRTNPYYEALQHLLYFRRLKPSSTTFNKLITFVAVIENEFLHLLLDRDTRALLILAHWLAMMGELGQWWMSVRCKSECTAITMFLMHDRDERIRELLRYPARTLGIVLMREG
jgi:hypothetical protein